jgi:hypothetical protein
VDRELERFKLEIDLADFAAAHGYAVDEPHFRQGARSVRLASERDKIIVARNASNGHWIYFTVLNEGDSGSVIDFLQNREGLSLGEVRKRLRRWLGDGSASAPLLGVSGGGGGAPSLATKAAVPEGRASAFAKASADRAAGGPESKGRPRLNLRLEPLRRDQADLLRAWALTRPVGSHPYLEGDRAIGKEVLGSERFAGRVRMDGRGNAVFPHFDAAGEVCGWEIKNAGFTGFSGGGQKGLWLSQERAGDVRLVVTESAIDALSHAALWPEPKNSEPAGETGNGTGSGNGSGGGIRYASTGGGFGETALALLRLAVTRLPETGEVVLAFDNDDAGRRYADDVSAGLNGLGRAVRVEFPPAEVKDWNDLLRLQKREQRR